MSRKSADLTGALVATKGNAAPAADMPGRLAASPAPAAAPAIRAAADERAGLNLQVPVSFRREFKRYAVDHDLTLVELVQRCFAAYRREQGN